jgi:hypothetical protein
VSLPPLLAPSGPIRWGARLVEYGCLYSSDGVNNPHGTGAEENYLLPDDPSPNLAPDDASLNLTPRVPGAPSSR